MDKASFLEETVGVVVVLSGFQENVLDSLGAKPVDGCLQQGIAHAAASALGIDQYVAHHAEGSTSGLFDIGNAESHKGPFVVNSFPNAHKGIVTQHFQKTLHPFFLSVRGGMSYKISVLDGNFPYTHLDFSVGDVLGMGGNMADEQVGEGFSICG